MSYYCIGPIPKSRVFSLGCPPKHWSTSNASSRTAHRSYEVGRFLLRTPIVVVVNYLRLYSGHRQANPWTAIGEAIAANGGMMIVTGCMERGRSVIRNVHPTSWAVHRATPAIRGKWSMPLAFGSVPPRAESTIR